MPRLVKGAKNVFGWSRVGDDGRIVIPPDAFAEYGFAEEGNAVLMSGSKKSGGFGLTTVDKIKESSLAAIITAIPELVEYKISEGTAVRQRTDRRGSKEASGAQSIWIEVDFLCYRFGFLNRRIGGPSGIYSNLCFAPAKRMPSLLILKKGKHTEFGLKYLWQPLLPWMRTPSFSAHTTSNRTNPRSGLTSVTAGMWLPKKPGAEALLRRCASTRSVRLFREISGRCNIIWWSRPMTALCDYGKDTVSK
jgi:hypothetical protein